MATIGEQTLKKASDLLGGLLFDYQKEIDEAYTKLPGKFHITLGLDIEPGQSAEFKLSGSIDFIAERIKDKAITMSDEDQGSLFDQPVELMVELEPSEQWRDTGVKGVTKIEITERHIEMEDIEKNGYCSHRCPFLKSMTTKLKGEKIKGAKGFKCISQIGPCENPVLSQHLMNLKKKQKDLF